MEGEAGEGRTDTEKRESEIRGERKGRRDKKGEEVGRRKVGGERRISWEREGRREGREGYMLGGRE